MASVAPHHVGHVAVDPLFEVAVGAFVARPSLVPSLEPLALGKFPLVAGLVHDKHAQLVADVVESGRMGIVGHAQGIHADVLQLLHTASPYLLGHSCAEHAGIIVDADSLHLHPLSVEGKALVGRELEGAEAGSHHRLVAIAEPGGKSVEVGAVEGPALGIADAELDGLLLLSSDGSRGSGHHAAAGIAQFDGGFQLEGRLRGPFVGSLDIDLQLSLLRIDACEAVGRSPLGKVYLGSSDEPYVAIDARSCVPTGVGLLRVVDAHCQHIVAICLQVGREVVEEGCESAGPLAQ